jgi:GNAT superfamily N-acetyltransferase
VSDDDYTIRRYESSDRYGFFDLYGRVFDESPSDEWFAWKYRDNPYFDGVPMVVAEAEGRLVGARPFLTMPIRAGEDVHLAFQPGDTMVDPSHQRRGLFTRMTERALDWFAGIESPRAAFCYNFPNEQSRPGYLKLGWREVGPVPVYRRVQNPAALLNGGRLRGRLATIASRSYLRATQPLRGQPADLSVERSSGVPAATLASLYERRVPAGFHAHRTPGFYRWRFANPVWEYGTYVVRRADVPVAAGVIGARERDGTTTARLVETVPSVPDGDSVGALRALLAAVVGDLGDADMLSTFGPAISRGPLTAWGFLRDDRFPLSITTDPATLVTRPIGTTDWSVDDHDLTASDDWHVSFTEWDIG